METSVRHLALEFLVSVVEASPAMCRKMETGDGASSTGAGGGDVAAGSGDGMMGVGEEEGGGERSTFASLVIPVCFTMMTELPVRFSRRGGGGGG